MIESPRKEVPSGVASGELPVAWAALIADCNCSVMVMDSDSSIYFANEMAAKLLHQTQVTGRRLHDFTIAPVAEERVAFIRESIASVCAITVDGMVAGFWRRTTYRPLPSEVGQRPRVLAVARMGSSYHDQSRPRGVVRARHDDTGALHVLTTREIEILCFIGEGYSSADIARHLHRSVKTIEWHRVALGTKLGIANRVELARIAIRAGLVQIDDVERKPIAQ